MYVVVALMAHGSAHVKAANSPSYGRLGSGQYLPHFAYRQLSSPRWAVELSGSPKMACQMCSMMKPSFRSASPGTHYPGRAWSLNTHKFWSVPTTSYTCLQTVSGCRRMASRLAVNVAQQ